MALKCSQLFTVKGNLSSMCCVCVYLCVGGVVREGGKWMGGLGMGEGPWRGMRSRL